MPDGQWWLRPRIVGAKCREELLALVNSGQPTLTKVGLKLVADKVRPEDKEMHLGLVRSDHSRVARLASEALAQNLGTWTLEDLRPLKQDARADMRRRGWWLRRSPGGWEAVIADLELLRDPDESVARLGRSPRPPMYFAPGAAQQTQVRDPLIDAPLSREQKLSIALAAGLRELLADLREQPRLQPLVAQDGAVPEVDLARPWWRRWRRVYAR